MGALTLCIGLLLLPQLGGTPRGYGETEAFDRVSPSGAYVLHVEIATQNGSGPGRAVLVRDGHVAWSRALPFTLAEAVVDDDGFVAGYGWPKGRPYGGCIGPSRALEVGAIVLDSAGQSARKRRELSDGQVSDQIEARYASAHEGAFAWVDALVDSDDFRSALSRTVPAIPSGRRPSIWTVQVRGTPLRALAWRNAWRTGILVVDGDFEPALATTLSDVAVLRSLAGGLLVVERDEPSPYALRFQAVGDGWIAERVETHELAEREFAEERRAPESWRPTSRVALGGAGRAARLEPWQASCVVAGKRVVAAEEKRLVAHVFDASTGNAVGAAVPPSQLLLREGITHGVSVVPASADGFSVRWGMFDASFEGVPYTRYDAAGGIVGIEDRSEERAAQRQLNEEWVPFGSMEERWVVSMGELRLWNGRAWTEAAIEHDAWGRWFSASFHEDGKVFASSIREAGAAENGDAVALIQRGNGLALTVIPRGERPSKTVPLPDGFAPGWGTRLAWDGTRAYLNNGSKGMVVLDTRDDSLRHVTIEGVEDLSPVDVHVVPETNELWLVDRERHELLRFALQERR